MTFGILDKTILSSQGKAYNKFLLNITIPLQIFSDKQGKNDPVDFSEITLSCKEAHDKADIRRI